MDDCMAELEEKLLAYRSQAEEYRHNCIEGIATVGVHTCNHPRIFFPRVSRAAEDTCANAAGVCHSGQPAVWGEGAG